MNKPQIKMLKKIKKITAFYYSDVNSQEKEILDFLSKNKFIKIKLDIENNKKPYYAITQLGETELHKIKTTFISIWLPILISLTALIKSFCPEIHLLLQAIAKLLK